MPEFEEKWIHGGDGAEELLGSADIQSLADLGNSYAVVREMRFVPFGWKDVTQARVAPRRLSLPLTLTIFSPQELAGQLIKVLF